MFDELLFNAREGDIMAKEEIINRLQPLIISSIRKYYNRHNEYDDLIQDGNVKVLECIGDFDAAKGAHFLGYVKTMLRYMYLDKNKKKAHYSLNEMVGDGDMELIDLLVSEDRGPLELILDTEQSQLLEGILGGLTKRQRDVVQLFYLEKMKIEDIGILLGVSYRTVVNTKTRAMEKLRERIID